ncbi:MAG: ABC transporter ATP-binding protein/permease [Gammaproteobacteria bacterium]|nr:ABC transporter ATP-binding protein/permease [Gammaproteobacteria bacterium]
MLQKPSKLSKLLELVYGQRQYAALLFLVMLLAALFEGFGLSLVFPLISGLIGLDIESPAFSGVLNLILAPFPEAYKMEGLLVVLIVAFFGKSLLMILQSGMLTHFAMHLRELWASRIFSNYMQAQYTYVIKEKHGTVVNNIVAEPLNASRAITMALQILSKVLVSVTLLALLLATDALMIVAVAAGAGIVLYFLWDTTHRYSFGFGKERLRLGQHISSVVTEGVGAIREIKIHGAEATQATNLSKRLERITNIQTKFEIFSSMPGNLGEFVVVLFIGLLLSYIHLSRGSGIKEVIPLLGFFILVSQRLLVYVSSIISIRMKIVSSLPSLQLMYALVHGYEDKQERVEGKIFTTLESDIVLKDINFAYEAGKPVFTRLNLTISLGKITGLVGPSGSGKSTIADLVLRLFEPQRGEILINNRNLNEWDISTWRREIGYVSQDPFIFNASIRDNILVGNPMADEAQLIQSTKMANIFEFIQGLPDRFDTVVGDRGVKVSGGQKQRIAIARAIIRDPELFIFDEATSSLDRESEKLIQQAIEELSRTTTTLIIAHRVSTLKNADIIYELGRDGYAIVRAYDHVKRQSAL